MKKLKNDELNRITVEEFHNSVKNPVVVILDNVRSLNNIGSIFRTCDAFLIEKIYLCGITGTPPHREIHKTALGATESVDWVYFEDIIDAIDEVKKGGFQIAAVEQADNSTMLHTFDPIKDIKYAFVFGNEVDGVSDEVLKIAEICIEIPQFGSKHSLNISVSAGIILWDYLSKLKFKDIEIKN